jgi:two-component system, OmpR family, copper resistance phosphate regulon response regulator CusR
MLAEDDVKLASLLTRAFGHIGLMTTVAPSGDAALRVMRTKADVKAVVLAIMLPHPDGIEVCTQLRRDGWRGPTVVISALDGTDLRHRVERAGADAFLAKPFHLADLVDTVERLIDGACQ